MILTMTPTVDEVPNQTCQPTPCFLDGLVVTKGGIRFTFSDPPSGQPLQYNVLNSTTENFVQAPNIQGRDQIFGVAFSVPVFSVQFGFLVDTTSPVANMATVSLFNNSAVAFATFDLASSDLGPAGTGFAEGQFTYNGALGPVTNISISPTGTGFTALAFDNLTVTTDPLVTTVPTASSLTLAITAIDLAGLAILLLRKQPA